MRDTWRRIPADFSKVRSRYGDSRTLFLHESSPMPAITALLHTRNDALRLGRALETLRPCAEILVVDHGSSDTTVRIAHEYGARVVLINTAAPPTLYLQLAANHWILCLEPRESISEGLEASLYEWSVLPLDATTVFSVGVREETPAGWIDFPAPQTRLVPRHWSYWHGNLPATEASAIPLEGELLRFTLP
jgi:hypothetical protein